MTEMLRNFYLYTPSKQHLPQHGYDRFFPPELLQLQIQTLSTVCLHGVILAFLAFTDIFFSQCFYLPDPKPLTLIQSAKCEINPNTLSPTQTEVQFFLHLFFFIKLNLFLKTWRKQTEWASKLFSREQGRKGAFGQKMTIEQPCRNNR